MRHRLIVIILGCLFTLKILAGVSDAAETRGLRVVAKDPASGQTSEVKLYNKSYAVIIGIDKYPNLPQDRQLAYAVKDAKGIEQVLKQQYKFDKIITLYDQQATKSRILELLTDELPTQMGEEDSLFIFWAGHGNQEKKSDGDLGYLIPFDGKMGKLTTVITMDEIKNTISKVVPAKHVFYVFDACYSGLLTTRAVDTKSRRDLAYLKEITRERVRQVLTAGGKGQEVLDSGRNGHSVFTGRLIEILEAKGDFVTANEIQAIIREKVSGDARARGHKQTPAYDAISGSGDYVFVPSRDHQMQQLQAEQEQRQRGIDKTIKEQEKIKRELTEIAELERKAKESANEREQRKAEDAKRVTEAKLTQARLQQQALEDEKRRNAQEQADLKRIDDERKRQLDEARQMQAKFQEDNTRRQSELQRLEQEQLQKKQEEDQKLAELRRQAEKRRKQALAAATDALSIEAAVVEIKNANARIDQIKQEFAAELARRTTTAKTRLNEKLKLLKQGHDQRMQTIQRQKIVLPAKPATLSKDEFETESDYRGRVARADQEYKKRVAEAKAGGSTASQAEQEAYNKEVAQVEAAYRAELSQLEDTSVSEQQAAIQPLQERIATLANQEYTLPPDSLLVELGTYDAEKQLFPVSIRNKQQAAAKAAVGKKTGKKITVAQEQEPYVKVAMNGTIPLSREVARSFKQQWQAGAVRPEVVAKAGTGKVQRIVLVNDGDGSVLECRSGRCMSLKEHKRIDGERLEVERIKQERRESIYTDSKTGLQWLRDANKAGLEMSWNDALLWVKTLRVGGYDNWRLPTIYELEAFTKSDLSNNGFYNRNQGVYWSSSVDSNDISSVRVVSMRKGFVGTYGKSFRNYVWPVRNAKEGKPRPPTVGSSVKPMEIEGNI